MMKMKKMNSDFVYAVFHPEYLVEILRAGARFPVRQAFSLPRLDSTQNEISDFVENIFPSLGEDRHEIWLKFRLSEDKSNLWFSIEDIISAHFYSKYRQEATSNEVLHTLKVYGIPVFEPLEKHIEHVIEEYYSKVREHVARSIVKAWFKDVTISAEFIEQLKNGYKYQQSSAPEKLPPIPSKYIWSHLVAYNPGLRKFDERPDVLWLQDIQEVIKRTDPNFKQDLRKIGEKYNSKYSDILDAAEQSKKSGFTNSKWIIENKQKEETYFSELDKHLSSLGQQESFFYSALFYFNWRESVLNSDYSGKLSDHKDVSYFLNNTTENPMSKAKAEALFTIVYAGGPRVFQKALIEARMKSLGIGEPNQPMLPKTPSLPKNEEQKPMVAKLFESFKKELGKMFENLLERFDTKKKKETQKKIKAICGGITKIAKGEFSHQQYLDLCLVFEVPAMQFDDYPKKESDMITENSENDPGASAEVTTESTGETDGQDAEPNQAVTSNDPENDPVVSAGTNADSPGNTEEQVADSNQAGASNDSDSSDQTASGGTNAESFSNPDGQVADSNQAGASNDPENDPVASAGTNAESFSNPDGQVAYSNQAGATNDPENDPVASAGTNADSPGNTEEQDADPKHDDLIKNTKKTPQENKKILTSNTPTNLEPANNTGGKPDKPNSSGEQGTLPF